jgi:hypothetical protein
MAGKGPVVEKPTRIAMLGFGVVEKVPIPRAGPTRILVSGHRVKKSWGPALDRVPDRPVIFLNFRPPQPWSLAKKDETMLVKPALSIKPIFGQLLARLSEHHWVDVRAEAPNYFSGEEVGEGELLLQRKLNTRGTAYLLGFRWPFMS